MNSLSSHVLDTVLGKPAAGMKITLNTPIHESFSGVTDADGRCKDWGDVDLVAGIYTLRFHCKDYLLAQHGDSFYPYVDISFEINASDEHYHVPLLVTPYSYSTYRGS